jgi:hypothetical protein
MTLVVNVQYLGVGAEEGELGEDLGHQLLVLQRQARLRSAVSSP